VPHPVHRKIFINIAVRDVERSVAFFTELGFAFDPEFTDDEAACLIINEQAFVMMLGKDRFGDFTTKAIVDAAFATEAILSVTAASRDEVNLLVERALAGGASPATEPIDEQFMYGRSFHDLDGHLWEIFHLAAEAFDEE
jgi:uncharacterized protein